MQRAEREQISMQGGAGTDVAAAGADFVPQLHPFRLSMQAACGAPALPSPAAPAEPTGGRPPHAARSESATTPAHAADASVAQRAPPSPSRGSSNDEPSGVDSRLRDVSTSDSENGPPPAGPEALELRKRRAGAAAGSPSPPAVGAPPGRKQRLDGLQASAAPGGPQPSAPSTRQKAAAAARTALALEAAAAQGPAVPPQDVPSSGGAGAVSAAPPGAGAAAVLPGEAAAAAMDSDRRLTRQQAAAAEREAAGGATAAQRAPLPPSAGAATGRAASHTAVRRHSRAARALPEASEAETIGKSDSDGGDKAPIFVLKSPPLDFHRLVLTGGGRSSPWPPQGTRIADVEATSEPAILALQLGQRSWGLWDLGPEMPDSLPDLKSADSKAALTQLIPKLVDRRGDAGFQAIFDGTTLSVAAKDGRDEQVTHGTHQNRVMAGPGVLRTGTVPAELEHGRRAWSAGTDWAMGELCRLHARLGTDPSVPLAMRQMFSSLEASEGALLANAGLVPGPQLRHMDMLPRAAERAWRLDRPSFSLFLSLSGRGYLDVWECSERLCAILDEFMSRTSSGQGGSGGDGASSSNDPAAERAAQLRQHRENLARCDALLQKLSPDELPRLTRVPYRERTVVVMRGDTVHAGTEGCLDGDPAARVHMYLYNKKVHGEPKGETHAAPSGSPAQAALWGQKLAL